MVSDNGDTSPRRTYHTQKYGNGKPGLSIGLAAAAGLHTVLDAGVWIPERGGRLSADDWAQGALDLIAEQGVAAVAVEPLARRLGVTKGSFYWHFPSRDALLQAALERWELVEQETVFGSVEAVPDPRERLRALFQVVAHEARSHIIYSELLKALDHPTVKPVIERVSGRRLDYLTASLRQAGLGRAEAQHRARLAYAAYVGFLQLNQLHQPRLQHDEFEAYVEHVMATLIPAP
jgi:AcrR family transcriptional regulator